MLHLRHLVLGEQLEVARVVNVNPVVRFALGMIERPKVHRAIHLAVRKAQITVMIRRRNFF